jgi:molybdopterin-guanine dinucleotide biosynthesis protein A
MAPSDGALAAVIAGGMSTRFGSPKALARVGGRRVVDRVADALRTALPAADIVAIVNDEGLAHDIGLPHRPDVLHDAGALAGLHAALVWARERDLGGVVAAGCDMPFLDPALLRELVARAADADAVLPESGGRRGVEPLCAWYGVRCIAAIEAAVARGDARMIGFHPAVRVVRMPLADVRAFGDPDLLFMNLNTMTDLARAERAVRGA